MRRSSNQPRLVLIGMLTLAGHIALIIALETTRPSRPATPVERETEIFFVPLPVVSPPVTNLHQSSPSRSSARMPTAPSADAPSTAITVAPEEIPPTIDWHNEAEIGSKKWVEQLTAKSTRRNFDASDRAASILAPQTEASIQFPWKPEDRKPGFRNGVYAIPFGKNCTLALGFGLGFSCGFK